MESTTSIIEEADFYMGLGLGLGLGPIPRNKPNIPISKMLMNILSI
jgi:hypothetical protein